MSNAFSCWNSLRRTPYQSFTALLVVITTFFMVYVFTNVLYLGEKVISYFETRPQILVFFQTQVTDAEASSAAAAISNLEYVDSVTLVSKSEAFEKYKNENSDEPLLLDLLTSDLFPVSLNITATSPEGLDKVRTEINKLDGVDEVDYRQDVIQEFLNWTNAIRLVGLVACGLFTIQFILVIMVITSMKVANKKRSINIMSILGASRGSIKGIFIRESMWLGLVGSLFAFGLVQLLLYFLQPTIIDFLGEITIFPLAWEFLALQAAGGSILAILLAAFSAWIAATRLIRK
jgi:cell division transport system permease protein